MDSRANCSCLGIFLRTWKKVLDFSGKMRIINLAPDVED